MKTATLFAPRLVGCALMGLGLLANSSARAGTFTTDFASGIPMGINAYGSAPSYDHTTGGRTGGALKLTTATASQQSCAIVDDLDPNVTIAGFDVTFNAYIGSGNGADGMSFVFGDFYDDTWGEEGPATMRGLTISFDVYNGGGTPPEAPAIDVKWDNVPLFHRLVGAAGATTPASPIGSATTIRTQPTANGAAVWWPVKIHVDTDGTLDLVYNNVVIFTNLPVFRPFSIEAGDFPQYGLGYRFGFGARTGGSYDNHWIDDLSITTYPAAANSGQPGLTSVSQQPIGSNAGAAGGAVVVFTNGTYSVDTGSVVMRYNATTVIPTITQADGLTKIAYYGEGGVLPMGPGTVSISYATTSTPSFANTFSYNFLVDPFATIQTNAVITAVDTSKPGFKARVYQSDVRRGPGNRSDQLIQAERQLALGYVDPTTGQPYPNTVDFTLAEPDQSFIESGVINYNKNAPLNAGGFNAGSIPPREDKQFPGIPGFTTYVPGTENFSVEFTGFLQLKAGGHRFGVNSDDGFRVTLGTGFDVTGTQLSAVLGSRGAADTFFDIVVPADGFYPIRLVYCQGGGDGSCEFFYFDQATGQKILVNDPENLAAPRAYRESPVANPSITRVLPVPHWIGAFPDEDVIVEITDGVYAVSPTGGSLTINGVPQTISVAKSGPVTTLKRAGSLNNLLPSGSNAVEVVYSYNKAGTPIFVTNNYSFSVAPYYGVLSPNYRVTGVADPGLRSKVHQMDKTSDANQGNGARIFGTGSANRMPWPEVQLNQGMINPTNGLPYPNLAQAGGNNFLYDFDFVNWQYNNASAAVAQAGWFRDVSPVFPLPGANPDIGVPGFPGTGTSYGGLENGVIEITTHLELKRGAHVFGFNSDDGFIAIVGPDAKDTLGTLVGFDNRGKGTTDTLVLPTGGNPPAIVPYTDTGSMLFSVIVPEDGIYPFRILFWQGGTGFNAEFFSINRTNGGYLLIGDTANGGIPAYRTYTGSARPYVKFSVCPSPWSDYSFQQTGPGPIKMIGRTRSSVSSADIYNYANLGAGIIPRPWANAAIGGVIANGTSDPNIKLLLNGVEVPATKTASGTDVTVAYTPEPPLPPGSTNTASLVYAGTTNSWSWVVESWTSLDPADAVPAARANPSARGFKVKMHKLAAAPANNNTLATAERQLAGELGANQATPGPEPDGSYIYPNILNWNNNVHAATPGVQLGNFQASTGYAAGTGWPFPFYADERVPGIIGTGNTDHLAAEVFAYLELPTAGYYRLGVNSDDGFGVRIGTPGVTNGLVIKACNVGKGATDVTVSFLAPQPGLYPIRLVYFNGTGGAALEFFSWDASGNKIPINDSNNPAAIKAYYALTSVVAPVITSANVTGVTITVTWENGGTLEWAPAITGPWTSTGDSDGSFSEAANGPAKFYRVNR